MVWAGLAQGDWNSSRIVLADSDSGEQEMLDAAEPYTHSQHRLKYLDQDLSSQLEAALWVSPSLTNK
jgi:hypothetical protein